MDRPDEPLHQLARGDERQRALLAEWGAGPERALPVAQLPQLFRERVRSAPDAVALVADGEEWSYGRLLTAVERTAAALRAAGIAPVTGSR